MPSSYSILTRRKKDIPRIFTLVQEYSLDLNFIWFSFDQYVKWHNWFVARYVKNNTSADRPKDIHAILEYRTKDFGETFSLNEAQHILVLDNTYSQFRSKKIAFDIVLKWNAQKPTQPLALTNTEIIHLPNEISEVISKANECYVSGHYEQCSVMIRKAIEFAIRLKLLQSGLKEDDLLDAHGNELTLSHKISLLRRNNLITQIAAKHLDEIKWYGDLGAHSRVRFTMDDIKGNVEPKARAFLTALALRE